MVTKPLGLAKTIWKGEFEAARRDGTIWADENSPGNVCWKEGVSGKKTGIGKIMKTEQKQKCDKETLDAVKKAFKHMGSKKLALPNVASVGQIAANGTLPDDVKSIVDDGLEQIRGVAKDCEKIIQVANGMGASLKADTKEEVEGLENKLEDLKDAQRAIEKAIRLKKA